LRTFAGVDPVEIAAGAVQLRPFDPTHLTELVAACQDPEIARWTRVPSPYTNDDAPSAPLVVFRRDRAAVDD
jgi:hypothetical protein